MAKKRVLGICFGVDNFTIAEIENRKIVNYYTSLYILSPGDLPVSIDALDKGKLAAIVQTVLREKAIDTKDVVVSLPAKDIILRSFFMPMMSEEELAYAAVEFEARKYIPFKPQDIIYDYQSFKVRDAGGGKLRIIFVGIKKELLDKYKYALEQSGLTIKYIEPSALSLERALMVAGKVDRENAQAVVEVTAKGGDILISDKGMPAFVNDFKFPATAVTDAAIQRDVLIAALSNDIRLSLDYYQRYTPEAKINSIIICYQDIPREIIEDLKNETEVPISSFEAKEILNLQELAGLTLLHAYGAGIRDYTPSSLAIDLNKITPERIVKEDLTKPGELTPKQKRRCIEMGIVAAIIVFAFYLFNLRNILTLQAHLRSGQQGELSSELGSLSDKELETMLSTLTSQSNAYVNLKKERIFSPLLDVLPRLLPEGVWLKSLSYSTGASRQGRSLSFSGSCFAEDRSMQLELVNQFVSNIKKDSFFAQNFKDINMGSMKQQEVNKFPVTEFEVVCR